ncbi:Origin recognition complex, subunit 1, partial [Dimargaris xerosporica]
MTTTRLQRARQKLHVSAVPDCLPCREAEFAEIASHLKAAIRDRCGNCICEY